LSAHTTISGGTSACESVISFLCLGKPSQGETEAPAWREAMNAAGKTAD
jgi:hypothetical protein